MTFKTKPELALDLIERADADGADSAYGDNAEFRRRLRCLGLDYAVGVHSSTTNFRDGELYRRSQVFLIPMASAYSWGTYDCCDRPDYH